MKIFKILQNKFATKTKFTQNSIENTIFNQMLASCETKKEQRNLYKMANSLPKDIFIESIKKNKDELFFDAGKMKDFSGFRNYIKSLCGTFVVYTNKNVEKSFYQQKISDELLMPPSKKTLSAIVKTFKNII